MSALGQLAHNLFGFGAAWDLWEWVKSGEVGGFAPRGRFDRAPLMVVTPFVDEHGTRSAVVLEVGAAVEFVWKQGDGEPAPRWPERYNVLSARTYAPQIEAALYGGAEPEQAEPEPDANPYVWRPYERPALSAEQQAEAAALALKLTNGKSMKEIRLALAALICENNSLTLEANEHRAARGLERLSTYQSNGAHP